jgi:hypothetical protein
MSPGARILLLAPLLLGAMLLCAPHEAHAFCGFYVGKADASLINHASQVAMVRDGDRTVISLMNDYQGEPSEFALVVPVPVVLQRDQVHVGDRELFRKLEAYSAPRLVEYHDPDPCEIMRPLAMARGAAAATGGALPSPNAEKSLGVTVEAQYTVGEYDIVMLSATQSEGLETWLLLNGYKIPFGARRALAPYIRDGTKFFVAKVNLQEHARTGLQYLRPLQFAFESPKFMLPIRLGMINAQGPQDLIIYLLTRDGRVETTNYRTVRLPTGSELPGYVRDEFPAFYKAMFDEQVKREQMRVVFTEYVWDMGWCDPCAAPPLTQEELRQLGVFWLGGGAQPRMRPNIWPYRPPMPSGPVPVILTRLHVRYSADTFPEDLVFQQTQDRENYQARYVLRVPWEGSPDTCPAARTYFDALQQRYAEEAQTLADLTGWDIGDVMKKVGLRPEARPTPWWRKIWE